MTLPAAGKHPGKIWIPALVIMLGALLRTGMLARDVRFHPDEALYASFARQVSLHGDLLLTDAPLDKPPLAIFATALSFSIFGPTEFAARLPSFFGSLLTLAGVYALARRLYGGRIAAVAALFLALSPLDLAFAATVFVDPLLICCTVLACVAASRDQWGRAGLAMAFALATKQSALQFIPLVMALGYVINVESTRGWPRRESLRRILRFTLPLLAGGALLILWSAARAAPTDFWTLGAYNNNPGRLIRTGEVLPRLTVWLDLLRSVSGFGPLLLFAVVPLWRVQPSRAALVDLILLLYVVGSLLVYWLVAFNTYDRYLLPLGPLILILVARGCWRVATVGARYLARRGYSGGQVEIVIVGLVVLATVPSAAATLAGRATVGGDNGQHDRIDVLAASVRDLPAGTTVYDYWLGWELRYYLGDQPAQVITFEPAPEALARAVCGQPSRTGYFVAPAADAGDWLSVLQGHGVLVQTLLSGPFRLYRLGCP